MGRGTGVLQAYHIYYLTRGLTTTILGTTSLQMARSSGMAQNNLLVMRGLGFTLGPVMTGSLLGKAMWSGESQSTFVLLLTVKSMCEFFIPAFAERAFLLCMALFTLGFAMAVIGTFMNILLCQIHGERCSVPLTVYFALYGIGGMLGPYLTLWAPNCAWQSIGLIDLVLAVAVFKNRLLFGKPRNWKMKVRQVDPSALLDQCRQQQPDSPKLTKPVPMGVFVPGLFFAFLNECIQTAISSWIFTFVVDTLGQAPAAGATFSSTFYVPFIMVRCLMLPLARFVQPSVFVQGGIYVTTVGALVFCWHGEKALGGTASDFHMGAMLVGTALLGVGTCPLASSIIGAMASHGDISSQRMGWYGTASTLGTTCGMWLPGLIRLSVIEFVWSSIICVVAVVSLRDFPLWQSRRKRPPAVFEAANNEKALGA